MKTKNILILGGLVGAGFWYVSSNIKQTISQLKFGFTKVKITGFKWLTLTLQLAAHCKLINGSQRDITLNFFKGKLYYGPFFLGDMVINKTNLKVGEEKQLSVNMEISLLIAANEILKIVASNWLLYTFHINGTIIFQVGDLPQITSKVNQDIPLAGKYTPPQET